MSPETIINNPPRGEGSGVGAVVGVLVVVLIIVLFFVYGLPRLRSGGNTIDVHVTAPALTQQYSPYSS